MIVVYSPEDGDKQQWEFVPGKVRAGEAERIEKRYGANWSEFLQGVNTGSIRARRVLLWHLMRRDHPMLRWEDTPDFYAGELTVDMSIAEMVEMRRRLSSDKTIDGEVKEQVVAALTAQIEAVEADSEADGAVDDSGDAEGKAS